MNIQDEKSMQLAKIKELLTSMCNFDAFLAEERRKKEEKQREKEEKNRVRKTIYKKRKLKKNLEPWGSHGKRAHRSCNKCATNMRWRKKDRYSWSVEQEKKII